MRIRPILLASLALLCSACISRIDFRSGEDENVLIVNARFYTDETHHGIQVDMSTLRESTSTVTDADVDVFINGRYHSRAEFYTPVFDGLVTRAVVSYDPILLPTGDYERRPGYYFDAELHPGDEISIEVTRGDLHASASATVPDAVELVSVDTLRVRENPYTANADVLKCVARIRDVPGERNWMRIANIDHYDVMAHYGPGPEGDTLTTWYTHTASMYFDDDPILRGDFHSSREQAAIRETGLNLPLVTNSYCIFTDSGFADSEHTAEIYMNGSFNYCPDFGWGGQLSLGREELQDLYRLNAYRVGGHDAAPEEGYETDVPEDHPPLQQAEVDGIVGGTDREEWRPDPYRTQEHPTE